ncbi:MAG: hypothetical protein SWE60_23520 [Thermodesulfobacteriota bacterium]|nr:hypothetical protein [Thermodesulfobacteriota bacterium]
MMKIRRHIEKDGLIVTQFGGVHTYKDALESLDELLALNKGSPAIYEIVVNDDTIELDFSREEEKALSGKVKAVFSHFDAGALAIVAKNDLVFGLSRMLQMSIDNERIAVAVFRSDLLARKWIDEIRKLHDERLGEVPS